MYAIIPANDFSKRLVFPFIIYEISIVWMNKIYLQQKKHSKSIIECYYDESNVLEDQHI